MMMKAAVLTGHGGVEKLEYRDVKIPNIGKEDVLLKVLACGVNNTDVNLRLGWYSKSVKTSTESTDGIEDKEDGGWNSSVKFPFIQGTDCCGRVVEMGSDVKSLRIGERVIVRPCQGEMWMGSDYDGAFAEYVRVPHTECFVVKSETLSDVELGSIPCAFATAENMLHRAKVCEKDHVLVPGASGGVGLAVVLLSLRRGAQVTAICGQSKVAALRKIIPRPHRIFSGRSNSSEWRDMCERLKKESNISVVVDNVGGDGFADLLEVLTRKGRYVTSGAIAGPVVSLDLRTLYLRDLTLIGSTAWDPCVFPNLVRYIETGEIKPVVHGVYKLRDIAKAQLDFMKKKHVGKFVLVP